MSGFEAPIKTDHMGVGLVVLLLVLGLAQLARRRGSYQNPNKHSEQSCVSGEKRTPGVSEAITPLTNLNWETTEPIKHRPFKPIYHITMAIRGNSPSELISIDSEYVSKLENRLQIMRDHRKTVMGCIDGGFPPLEELYTYLFQSYLPARFPTIFAFSQDKMSLQNQVTGKKFPCTCPKDPLVAWEVIGQNVEEDMFILLPTEKGHRVMAFLCCFPAGFDPSSKLGLLLKDVHAPVPSYEKIGPSMERFFTKLEAGKSFQRVNWSVTTSPDLFGAKGNHIHDGDTFEEDQIVDIEKARLRTEMQTVTRLPRTGAVLFSFKTYIYPVKDIKAEGLGPEFADAIDGLTKGNAPGMWVYKAAVRWGKDVARYLRSEDEV